METNTTLVWLDDARNPYEKDWLDRFSPLQKPYEVIWAKNYDDFVDWITENGMPEAICFDHDLGEDHETSDEKSGMKAAKWLIDYCLDNDLNPPLWNVQSDNPAGRDNINGIILSYIKFRKDHL